MRTQAETSILEQFTIAVTFLYGKLPYKTLGPSNPTSGHTARGTLKGSRKSQMSEVSNSGKLGEQVAWVGEKLSKP